MYSKYCKSSRMSVVKAVVQNIEKISVKPVLKLLVKWMVKIVAIMA